MPSIHLESLSRSRIKGVTVASLDEKEADDADLTDEHQKPPSWIGMIVSLEALRHMHQAHELVVRNLSESNVRICDDVPIAA